MRKVEMEVAPVRHQSDVQHVVPRQVGIERAPRVGEEPRVVLLDPESQ